MMLPRLRNAGWRAWRRSPGAVFICALVQVGFMGCAGADRVGGGIPFAPSRIAHRVLTEFASDIPDAYLVTSGPADAFRAYPVNGRYRRSLEAYARMKSTPAGLRELLVRLRVLRLTTAYVEIGHRGPAGEDGGLRYGDAAPPGGAIQVASLGTIVTRPGLLLDEHPDPRLPHEIRKTAEIAVLVSLHLEGAVLGERTLTARSTDVFERMFDPGAGVRAYDYDTVLRQVFDKVLVALDQWVDELVPAP